MKKIRTASVPAAIAQVPVQQEPRHHLAFENEWLRVLEPQIPAGDTTLEHLQLRLGLVASRRDRHQILMRRAGRVVARNTIVQAVWSEDDDVEENTLDAFISLLRNKVDRDHKVKLIQTVRGTGYTIRDAAKT